MEGFINGPATEEAFRLNEAAFSQALSRRPDLLWTSRHAFAGRPVHIRIVGNSLADHVIRAFSHLRPDDGKPPGVGLTIDLWDEEEAETPRPQMMNDRDAGATWSIGAGHLTVSRDARFVALKLQTSAAWLDRRDQRIIGSLASGRRLSQHERGTPLHLPLTVWYSDRGIHLLHAGLISLNGQGLLLPGTGGTGKSTTALASVCAGFDYLGDDYIGLEVSPVNTFVGYSLYDCARLEPKHLARFPLLVPHAVPPLFAWEEKSLILVSRIFPHQLTSAASIRALVLPRVTASQATLWFPASKVEGFLRLVSSSLLSLIPRPGPQAIAALAQLAEHVPSYWLDLGADLEEIPARVAGILAEVSQA